MNNENFRFEEDHFSNNAQNINKTYHEALLLMKFLQTKPQVKNMNFNYYDLFYTVIKNRKEKNNVEEQYENNENDYINFNDIIPNHYVGIKLRETKLNQRKMRSWINHFNKFLLYK